MNLKDKLFIAALCAASNDEEEEPKEEKPTATHMYAPDDIFIDAYNPDGKWMFKVYDDCYDWYRYRYCEKRTTPISYQANAEVIENGNWLVFHGKYMDFYYKYKYTEYFDEED